MATTHKAASPRMQLMFILCALLGWAVVLANL